MVKLPLDIIKYILEFNISNNFKYKKCINMYYIHFLIHRQVFENIKLDIYKISINRIIKECQLMRINTMILLKRIRYMESFIN